MKSLLLSLPLLLLPAAAGPTQAAAPAPPVGSDERFGVMTHFAQGWPAALIPSIASQSIATVRDELYWSEIETQPGVFAFPEHYDRYMTELQRQGLSPLVVLSFGNPLYDGGDTPHTPEGMAGYARYAVEVLRHYGTQIKAVEIWNEYNGDFAKGPATADRAGNYLRLLRTASAAIRRERPDVLIVGGATSGVPLPYWDKLLAGGILENVDALSIHPYRYDEPPEGIETVVAGLQELVRRHDPGSDPPIWVTEIGWATKASQAPGDLTIDEQVQARFLTRAYALLLSAAVPRVYWYLYRDYHGLAMGLVRDEPDNPPKPAARALATLARQLGQARFAGRDDSPADFYSLRFVRPNGESLRVVWSLQPRMVKLTGVTAAVNLVGQPVALEDPFRLDDSPLFLSGPVAGLPAPPPDRSTLLADSVVDFSCKPDTGAWSYGEESSGVPAEFVRLTALTANDWKAGWSADRPGLLLSAQEQHPSVDGATPIAAVRRWRSPVQGTVRIAGAFRCGLQGDGVGVSVVVDGTPRFRRLIGGGGGNPIVENFDFTLNVRPGTIVDFAVDPGPAANIDFDATSVAISIRQEGP